VFPDPRKPATISTGIRSLTRTTVCGAGPPPARAGRARPTRGPPARLSRRWEECRDEGVREVDQLGGEGVLALTEGAEQRQHRVVRRVERGFASARGRAGGRAVARRRAGVARAGSGVGGGARGQVVRAWSGQRGVEEVAHEAGREGDGVFELAARGFQDGGVL